MDCISVYAAARRQGGLDSAVFLLGIVDVSNSQENRDFADDLQSPFLKIGLMDMGLDSTIYRRIV